MIWQNNGFFKVCTKTLIKCFIPRKNTFSSKNTHFYMQNILFSATAADCCVVKAGERVTFSSHWCNFSHKLEMTFFSKSMVLPNFAFRWCSFFKINYRIFWWFLNRYYLSSFFSLLDCFQIAIGVQGLNAVQNIQHSAPETITKKICWPLFSQINSFFEPIFFRWKQVWQSVKYY